MILVFEYAGMTAKYDRFGITFAYPENWQIEEDAEAMPRAVSAHAPVGGFWSVNIHPFSMSPHDLLDQVLQTMCDEYDGVEYYEIRETILDFEASGYSLDFCCLDFVVSARIVAFQHGHATYLLMYQAESRDFDQLQPVFRAMTFSLLSEAPAVNR